MSTQLDVHTNRQTECTFDAVRVQLKVFCRQLEFNCWVERIWKCEKWQEMKITSISIFILCAIILTSPQHLVSADEEVVEATKTELNSSLTKSLLFGDKCESTHQCNFPGSTCYDGFCSCSSENSVTNHIDKCGKPAAVGDDCFFNEQCEENSFDTECRKGMCSCRPGKIAISRKDMHDSITVEWIECIDFHSSHGNSLTLSANLNSFFTLIFILAIFILPWNIRHRFDMMLNSNV